MEDSPQSVYETLKRKAESTLANRLSKAPKLKEPGSCQTDALSHRSPASEALSLGRNAQAGDGEATSARKPDLQTFSMTANNGSARNRLFSHIGGASKRPSPNVIDVDATPSRTYHRSTPHSTTFGSSIAIDVDAVSPEPTIRKLPEAAISSSDTNNHQQRPHRSHSPVIIESDSNDCRQKRFRSRRSITIDLDSDNDDRALFSKEQKAQGTALRSSTSPAFAKELSLQAAGRAQVKNTDNSMNPGQQRVSLISSIYTKRQGATYNAYHDRFSSTSPSTASTTSDTTTSASPSTSTSKDGLPLVDDSQKTINTSQTNETAATPKSPQSDVKDDRNFTSRSDGETDKSTAAAMVSRETKQKDEDDVNVPEDDVTSDPGSDTLSENEVDADTESDVGSDETEEDDLDEVRAMRQRLHQLNQSRSLAIQRKREQIARQKALEEQKRAATIQRARVEAQRAEQEKFNRMRITSERLEKERLARERLAREKLDQEKVKNERFVASNNKDGQKPGDQEGEQKAWKDFTQAQNMIHPNTVVKERMKTAPESFRHNFASKPSTPVSAQRLWASQIEPVFGQVFKHDSHVRREIGKIDIEDAAELVRLHKGKPSPTQSYSATSNAHGLDGLAKLRAEAQKDAERIRAPQVMPVSQDPALLEQIRQQAQQDVRNLRQGIQPNNDDDSLAQPSITTPLRPASPHRSHTSSPSISKSVSNATNNDSSSLGLRNIFHKKSQRDLRDREGPIELHKVTQTDWYLVELVKQGLTWAQIHEIWEAKTGQSRKPKYYRYRYRRMHFTFPDEVPPAVETREARYITLKTAVHQHAAHTENDIMSTIIATPDFPDTEEVTSRPSTGGKTLSPEMIRYFLARSPTPEATDSDEEEEATQYAVTSSSSAHPGEKHRVYYLYEVQRKVVLGGKNPETVEWVTESKPFTSKKAANAVAFRAAHLNHDGLDFEFTEERGRFSKANGLWSAEQIGERGTVYVRVHRRPHLSREGDEEVLFDRALPYTVYDVFEKRTLTVTTKEWKLKPVIESAYEEEEEEEHEDNSPSNNAEKANNDNTGIDSDCEEEEAGRSREPLNGQERSKTETSISGAGDTGDEQTIATMSDAAIDSLFEDESEDDEPIIHKKRVRFADEVKLQNYDEAEHSSKIQHEQKEHKQEQEDDRPRVLEINLDDYTLHSTTQTFTATTLLDIKRLYTNLHIANDDALARLYTLRTEPAKKSFLLNPTVDDKDFSLNWEVPGRSERAMDRQHHKNTIKAEIKERLEQLDAEAEDGDDGEGMFMEVFKGIAWTLVERWDAGEAKDEGDDEEEDEDEDENETAFRKRVTMVTEIEIWVQARNIEGPRNP